MAANRSGVRPGLDGRVEVNTSGDNRSADTDRGPHGNQGGHAGHANGGRRYPTRALSLGSRARTPPSPRAQRRAPWQHADVHSGPHAHRRFSRHMAFIMLSPKAFLMHTSWLRWRNALISDQRVWEGGHACDRNRAHADLTNAITGQGRHRVQPPEWHAARLASPSGAAAARRANAAHSSRYFVGKIAARKAAAMETETRKSRSSLDRMRRSRIDCRLNRAHLAPLFP